MDKSLTSFTFFFMIGSFIIAVKGKLIWQYNLSFGRLYKNQTLTKQPAETPDFSTFVHVKA